MCPSDLAYKTELIIAATLVIYKGVHEYTARQRTLFGRSGRSSASGSREAGVWRSDVPRRRLVTADLS
jgi:hypothetical protein